MDYYLMNIFIDRNDPNIIELHEKLPFETNFNWYHPKTKNFTKGKILRKKGDAHV